MGQLGAGDSYMDIYSVEDIPRAIDSESLDGKEVVSISAGKGRSACITACGELYIWGNKLNHEPMKVSLNGDMKVTKVVCGGRERQHCIAIIMEDGSLWTMGDGESHMLGRREFATKNPTFERVEAFHGKKVLDVHMGLGNHIMAIVEEEVEFMFGDVVGTGQGIGTSDITACMNACVPAVNGRFEIDLGIMRGMINDALCALEEGVA